MGAMTGARTPPGEIRIVRRGHVRADEVDCAREMIGAVVAAGRIDPVVVRVRLTAGTCAGGPVLVQVNLRVCGAPARIQIAGRTARQAITAAAARLQRQIARLTVAWQPWPWPDPEKRSLGIPGAGAVARLKTYRMHLGTPSQATAFMNAMDYDVTLYTDAETGEDAIIYRAGPTGLCLSRQHSIRPPSLPVTLPLTINPRRVPQLAAVQAAHRLAEGWLPFVFYIDRRTRRGNLLYRRYDGDLGLIAPTPPETDDDTTTTQPSRPNVAHPRLEHPDPSRRGLR